MLSPGNAKHEKTFFCSCTSTLFFRMGGFLGKRGCKYCCRTAFFLQFVKPDVLYQHGLMRKKSRKRRWPLIFLFQGDMFIFLVCLFMWGLNSSLLMEAVLFSTRWLKFICFSLLAQKFPLVCQYQAGLQQVVGDWNHPLKMTLDSWLRLGTAFYLEQSAFGCERRRPLCRWQIL